MNASVRLAVALSIASLGVVSVMGPAVADASGPPGSESYERAVGDLDFWLRSDYHRRNPGTTADIVAAGLFAALREGIIPVPFRL